MKRSASLGLVVMGAAAFTATFAGGSAFMAWRNPAQSQTCVPRPDGTQACTPTRTPAGVARYVHVALFPGSSAAATPPVRAADAAAPAPAPVRVMQDGTMRRGFGASAKTAFRGSAGG
jgi:hypothetical protein